MRFAWLKENATDYTPVTQGFAHPLALIRKAYNLAFWIFLVPFFTSMQYSTGFIVFTIVILIRLVVNLNTNNLLDLTPAQYESFPLRIP